MMKKVVSASVIVLLALDAAGLAASSLDVTLGSLSPGDDVTWGGFLSGSWAVAGNDSTSQDVSEFLPQSDTTANASVASANAGAFAATQERLVAATAVASTGPGSSAAYAYAEQRIWFTAEEDGDLDFDLDFTVAQSLSSLVNETAFADASIGLSLYREGGMMDTMDDDTLVDESTFYVWNFTDGSGDLSQLFDDTLSVYGSFGAQETGYLWLRVDGQAVAAVIPAPGAILLSMIGTGLVGFLRRRTL